MNIDIHNHFIPEAYFEAVRSDPEAMGARLDLRGKQGDEYFVHLSWGHTHRYGTRHTDLKRRIQVLDKARIDVAAISLAIWITGYNYSSDIGRRVATVINDALEDIVQDYGGRFVALGHVPLQDVDASIAELEKRRFHGFQILSNVNGRNLDDPAFLPFFKAADRLGTFLFVHPGEPNIVGADRLGSYSFKNFIGNVTDTAIGVASLMFGGIYDACPNLKLCFAHAGGSTPFIWGRWAHGQRVRSEAKVRTTTPIEDLKRRVYFDTLSHSPSAFRFLLGAVGADRVMLGTDCPANMADMDQVAKIENMGLPDADVKRILGGTAAALLGL
jgi:aminocarboxymuconate-semialdehyde decarboxylase